ncbi:serine/threonine-protein kinase, partial [Streptomyces sp. SID3343]|uniref:protein kinase domain-containing protein n=1 Tax=Streptomyces sp. SID3343 TaxID=2690260 RepID=UPI0013692358|nr:protein kinase [Streptomyces sp. SID3343]
MTNDDYQRVIADRYRLVDRIGRGGMGTVWSSWDQLLERTVAVKELHIVGEGEEDRTRLRRVLREARAVARISHPYVIDIHDLVEFEDRLWIVMELVDGPSLSQHLAGEGPLPLHRVAEIGLQLLAALEAVHKAGALHRDVKPANVLLRGDGSVVLVDFGIAALADNATLTLTGDIVGSVDFMAPERLHHRPTGPPSDLFSLGATLCVLATGTAPFSRSSPAAVVYAVAHEPPFVAEHAGPLRPLVEALLRKDPDERPTAPDVAVALRSMCGPTTVLSPPQETRQQAPPSSGSPRRRLRWAAVASVVAVLTGGGVTAYVVGHSSKSPPQFAESANQAPGEPGTPTPKETATRTPKETATRAPTGAVMQAPDKPNEYWVFLGDRYQRMWVDDGDHKAQPMQEPKPLSNWSAFRDLPQFSARIDAVMQAPDTSNQYWVFSGDQYILIEV